MTDDPDLESRLRHGMDRAVAGVHAADSLSAEVTSRRLARRRRRAAFGAVPMVILLGGLGWALNSGGDPVSNNVASVPAATTSTTSPDSTVDTAEPRIESSPLLDALSELGVSLDASPAAAWKLRDDTWCGVARDPLGIISEPRDRGPLTCFIAAHEDNNQAAVMVYSTFTDEGDPIIWVYRTIPSDPSVAVLYDATRDQFGSGTWEAELCETAADASPFALDDAPPLMYPFVDGCRNVDALTLYDDWLSPERPTASTGSAIPPTAGVDGPLLIHPLPLAVVGDELDLEIDLLEQFEEDSDGDRRLRDAVADSATVWAWSAEPAPSALRMSARLGTASIIGNTLRIVGRVPTELVRLDGTEFSDAVFVPVTGETLIIRLGSPHGPSALDAILSSLVVDADNDPNPPTDPLPATESSRSILRPDGLADLRFDTPREEVIAALTATFGNPDAQGPEPRITCVDEWTVVWGGLTVAFDSDGTPTEMPTFSAWRYSDLDTAKAEVSSTTGLATPEGITLGAPAGALRLIPGLTFAGGYDSMRVERWRLGPLGGSVSDDVTTPNGAIVMSISAARRQSPDLSVC